MPKAKKVKEYNDKKWDKTGHDLDFVFSRDGVAYGCEIKNTLGYIDKEELEVKLEMCVYFGIKPLFIMRYSPKSYNKMIYENGGFALIFETQNGIIGRFEKWHSRSNV